MIFFFCVLLNGDNFFNKWKMLPSIGLSRGDTIFTALYIFTGHRHY